MAGDIEGIGDIVTGGLAAATISRGSRQSHARHSVDADIEHGLLHGVLLVAAGLA